VAPLERSERRPALARVVSTYQRLQGRCVAADPVLNIPLLRGYPRQPISFSNQITRSVLYPLSNAARVSAIAAIQPKAASASRHLLLQRKNRRTSAQGGKMHRARSYLPGLRKRNQ
jgi:hypothetical protein